jgi:hypothetical protein
MKDSKTKIIICEHQHSSASMGDQNEFIEFTFEMDTKLSPIVFEHLEGVLRELESTDIQNENSADCHSVNSLDSLKYYKRRDSNEIVFQKI